jgi:hypothetical protein
VAQVPLMANSSGVNTNVNVTDLVKLFTGQSGDVASTGSGTASQNGSTSTAGTTATISGSTPEAIQAIFQQALQQAGGLGSVAAGQAGAGLYNSSTNQLMQNDLVSRVAGQVLSQISSKSRTIIKLRPLRRTLLRLMLRILRLRRKQLLILARLH